MPHSVAYVCKHSTRDVVGLGEWGATSKVGEGGGGSAPGPPPPAPPRRPPPAPPPPPRARRRASYSPCPAPPSPMPLATENSTHSHAQSCMDTHPPVISDTIPLHKPDMTSQLSSYLRVTTLHSLSVSVHFPASHPLGEPHRNL